MDSGRSGRVCDCAGTDCGVVMAVINKPNIDPTGIAIEAILNAGEDESIVWLFPKGTDLTGYTAWMQLRRKLNDATVALELTTANSGIVIDNANSDGPLVIAVFSDTQTRALSGTYSFDIFLKSAGGQDTKLSEGKIVINPASTRPA